MLAALDALQHLERSIVAQRDLVDALKLVGDAEAFADELQRHTRTARCRLPSAEEQQPIAVESGQRGDRLCQRSRRRVRVGKAANRPINRHQLKRRLLPHDHHHLL